MYEDDPNSPETRKESVQDPVLPKSFNFWQVSGVYGRWGLTQESQARVWASRPRSCILGLKKEELTYGHYLNLSCRPQAVINVGDYLHTFDRARNVQRHRACVPRPETGMLVCNCCKFSIRGWMHSACPRCFGPDLPTRRARRDLDRSCEKLEFSDHSLPQEA